MGAMRFNDTRWIKGHGTFGAHEGGPLKTYIGPNFVKIAYYHKVILNLQNQVHKIKPQKFPKKWL
jgi:hypothetical protein